MSNWETKFTKKGFTFDDVLLIPAESHVFTKRSGYERTINKKY